VVRVEIQNLSVHYGDVRAVRDVSLEIEPGEIFFLLGPSGCGKTTLLRALAGLIRPAAGEVLFNSRPMGTIPVHERNIGFVFQNYALWPHLTVAENVEYGLLARKVEPAARTSRVAAALRMLGLTGFEERRPGELSGGQQQRVAVARAVVIEPDVLLLDEPLSNLDARLRAEMRRDLKALVRRVGVTTIYVTHDQREALSMADRVAVMREGAIVQHAPPRVLYTTPQSEFVASFVGEANILDGEVVRVSDELFEVATPTARLKVAAAGKFEKGDRVKVLIRPEDFLIGPAGSSTENPLEGRIVDEAYLGGVEELVIEMPGATRVSVMRIASGDESRIELGDAVELSVPASQMRLFKADPEEALEA
jgi:ABC-type Fe3+/spermidine/putrescine transport system ATPase subunit